MTTTAPTKSKSGEVPTVKLKKRPTERNSTSEKGVITSVSTVSTASGTIADHADKFDSPIVSEDDTSVFPEPTHLLTLHSHEAQILWKGRGGRSGKFPIPGCVDFSKSTRLLCEVARNRNDPYAVFQLIRIEKSLASLDSTIRERVSALKDILTEDEDTGLEYHGPFMKSFTAEQYPVLFASGYGYAAARALGRFDKLVILSITARNCALMPNADWATTIADSSKRLRALYALSLKFRASGVTVEDIKSGNARSKDAIAKFGDIPADIISGRSWPKLLHKASKSLNGSTQG